MPRRASGRQSSIANRESILKVARDEFAARGFAATRVETLARKARVNKALLYYYFGSKLGLYRQVVRDGIDRFATRMRAVAEAPLSAEEKLRRWINALAEHMTDEPTMPLTMLREVADGGVHLDLDALRELTTIIPLVHGLIRQGQREGVFGDADPIALHFVLLGSTILFTANAPIRRRIRQLGLAQPPLELAPFVNHLQQVALRSLRKDPDHVQPID
jgi:TetR/AcrR family transcriptional regulator